MPYDKKQTEDVLISILFMVLLIFLIPVLIGYYLAALVYFFFPYKLAVGFFFAGFAFLLILSAIGSKSGYLVLSICLTLCLAGAFIFFPESEITQSSLEYMEETKNDIQLAVNESDTVFEIIREQGKKIPARMIKGFKENLEEIRKK